MLVTLGKKGVPTMLNPHTDPFSDCDARNSALRSATMGALSELPAFPSPQISGSHGGCAIKFQQNTESASSKSSQG